MSNNHIKELPTISKLAANRAEFFVLLCELESIDGSEIDIDTLTAEIDAEAPGQDRVSASEARRILRAIR
jgi:hypothetical protein